MTSPPESGSADFARRDSRDFARAFQSVAPALVAWSRLRVLKPLQRRIDAEDIVQEVCCRAWAGYAGFDALRAPFREWVFGIARNVMKEALVALGRPDLKPALMGGGGGSTASGLSALPDELTSLSRRAARDEELARFVNQAAGLPEEDRRLLLYRGVEGLSHAEVAERLGISCEAAEKRWERLRARLAAWAPPPGLFA